MYMDWPARSLVLNLIEHVWDMLQHAVSARSVQQKTFQELKDALVCLMETDSTRPDTDSDYECAGNVVL